jgi:putative acetyltransferase
MTTGTTTGLRVRDRRRRASSPLVRVRQARPADASALPTVHRAAVHERGSRAYDDAVLDVWGRDRDPDAYPVDEPSVVFVVAERLDAPDDSCLDETRVVGFAELRPAGGGFHRVPGGYGEVRAVYVHPDHADRGVGTRLLARLERAARRHGLRGVGLQASANAAGFYEQRGYDRLGEFDHEFTDGVTGPVVEFARRLSATASRRSSASPRS